MKKLGRSWCFFITAIFLSFGNTTLAANSQQINLNVDGLMRPGENPVIINQTTMVPIRTVSYLPNFSVNWHNPTKTVIVTNKTTKETLKLTLGKKEAYKGNTKLMLSTAPRNINGSIYVPFRFITESLDAYARWDAETKTAVIYNSDVKGAETNKNMVIARNAVLSLTRISLHEPIATTSESHVTQYYFPYGQTQKFFILNGDIVQYYEVKDHAAWRVWEGKISNGTAQSDEKDVLPTVSVEWGKRPAYTGGYVYFTDEWMAGHVSYGTIDASGKGTELGSFFRGDNSKPLIVGIGGEQRVD